MTGWLQNFLSRSKSPFAIVLGLAILIGVALTVVTSMSQAANVSTETPYGQQNQMQFPEGLDYSKFQHGTRNHSRLPCLLCHRRDSNAPVPKRPGSSDHLPCAGCHAQQFSNSDSPICTICHTDVKSGALKPFPHLTSFRMKFDHSSHIRMAAVNCSTCHKPVRPGASMSIPVG